MYIGEIAPPKMRGKLVSMNQINIVLGLSAAYFINYLILQASTSGAAWVTTIGLADNTWRWMLGAEIIPAATWLILLFTIPESPRWLILKGRQAAAKDILNRIQSEAETQTMLKEVERDIRRSGKSLSTFSQIKQLFAPHMRTAFTIGLVVAIVQPITGINAIMFYAPTVFEQVGIGTDAAFMQAVYVGLSSTVFTVLALLLIDRIGRRPLILWGLLWGVVSLGVCSYGFGTAEYRLSSDSLSQIPAAVDVAQLEPMLDISYYSDLDFKAALRSALGQASAREHEGSLLQLGAHLDSTLILLGILSFIGAFHFSIGPIMWVLFSEIFPIKIRGIAIPFFALITSIISYLVQQFFPWQLTVMGASEIFLFYAVMSAFGLIILFRTLPETKNKSIEEIETTLAKTPPEPILEVN